MPYFVLGFAILVVLLVMASIKILREYERAVVFFLGRFQRVMGPGLIIVIPVVALFVFMQRRFIEGMAGGSVKG